MSGSPIVDMIRRLMSRGLSLEMALDEAEIAEVATATSRGAKGSTREYERIRKAEYRSRKSQEITGTVPTEGITSKPLVKNVVKKERKNTSPDVPGTNDGWPADHLEQFWQAFPPFRREAKRKVGEKLARIRSGGKASWEQLLGAVRRYAGTDPGQYACAPLVWLNGERWDREYGTTKQGGFNATNRNSGGRGGHAIIGAQLRRKVAERNANAAQSWADAAGGEPGDGFGDSTGGVVDVERGGQGSATRAPSHR